MPSRSPRIIPAARFSPRSNQFASGADCTRASCACPGCLSTRVAVAPDARKTYLPDYEPRISGEAPLMAASDGPRSNARSGSAASSPSARCRTRRCTFGQFRLWHSWRHSRARRSPTAQANYWGTVEQGIHNGEMLDGPMFGAARNPDAIVASNDQFDFYSGGGIDIAFLGMGEMDGGRQCQCLDDRRPASRPGRLHRHHPDGAQSRVLRDFRGEGTRGGARLRWRVCESCGRATCRSWSRSRACHVQRRAGARQRAGGALCDGAGGVPARRRWRRVD